MSNPLSSPLDMLNPKSSLQKGHMAVTVIITVLALATTAATGFFIRPAKPRPVWFMPLLFLGSLSFLVSLFVSIAAIAESLNYYPIPSYQSITGTVIWPVVPNTSPIAEALVPLADVFLFPVMFLTLTHRLYSSIALAMPTSVARIVKAVFDGILVTITLIICMVMFGWGALLSMPGVVLHILVVIDIAATAFYVRYKLRDAGFKNDQIMHTFLRITLPLTVFRIVYRMLANIIQISLTIDNISKVARMDPFANERLEYGLALANKIVIGLTTLAIIGSLLRLGIPANVSAWNLQGKDTTVFPGSTTFGSPGGVQVHADKAIQPQVQSQPQAQPQPSPYYPQASA